MTRQSARTPAQLRADALRIWQAGLAAVASDYLVREALALAADELCVGDLTIDLRRVRRIVVVGGGKAGAGMAAALEEVLGRRILSEKQIQGWVNVPADCVRPLAAIHLHSARPAGRNEPTAEGVRGTDEILRLVGNCTSDDLCFCLLSGGASALMPAPVEAITLANKLAITRHLSAAGANIAELNTVRKQLSRVKGGGLLRACRAGRLIALVISDVIGDPLDLIGSGPTTPDSSTPAQALSILEKYDGREAGIAPAVFEFLRNGGQGPKREPQCQYDNFVIGNNARAVDGAGEMAEHLGYSHVMHCATRLEGAADDVGRHLAQMALQMRNQFGPDCLITGGEPTVRLVDEGERGLGGRNQQLVLAALVELEKFGLDRVALLSGATDGEDGPTDAAGAVVDAEIAGAAARLGLDPVGHLARNDAYHFFQPVGGLIKTGPTNTNVCDVRVVVVDRGLMY